MAKNQLLYKCASLFNTGDRNASLLSVTSCTGWGGGTAASSQKVQVRPGMAYRLKSWLKNRTRGTQDRPCRGIRLTRNGLTLLEPGFVAEHSGSVLSCHKHTEWGRNRNRSSTSTCYTRNILDYSSPGVWPQHEQLQFGLWQPIWQEKWNSSSHTQKNKPPPI